ncbi:MAG: hypothetical protein AVDCRST_MAG01-01-1151 [uncultured Rubrobacteraceae bacterium]|uniref:Uncharacterized protein n=1 Tax=uncultured Rubrobacteraceae bacterium TaxID=349277 RepID=A0A6J4P167_9ACTN|nr:MAG: hypothetical protein AVDCRST_MAG01-01-1151 [uncultured Rubrobacteraceae bacterium]
MEHRSENAHGTLWKVNRELSQIVPAALSVATGGVVMGATFFGMPGAVVGAIVGAALGTTAVYRRNEQS